MFSLAKRLLKPRSRLEKACAIDVVDDASFRTRLALYDERADADDPAWLNVLALAYDCPSTRFHDDARAHDLFVRAADLGSDAAAYNLGVRWLHGYYGAIDVARAEAWFLRAFELGHGCAGAHAAEIAMAAPQYGQQGQERFTNYAHGLMELAEKVGGPWATYLAATMHASGRAGTVDPKQFVNRYFSLAADETCGPPRARACTVLALHGFLGLHTNQDNEFALRMIDKFPRKEKQPDVRYGLARIVDRLRYIIAIDVVPHQETVRKQARNDAPLPADHQKAHDFLMSVFDGRIAPAAGIAAIETGKMPATRALGDRLWAAATLASLEGDFRRRRVWLPLLSATQLKLLTVSEQQVRNSTRDFGPVYNDFNPAGYPIPGRPRGAQPTASTSGFGALSGLTATRAGAVDFAFKPLPDGAAPLIFPEDISVALALAFGDTKGARLPWLSIEEIDQETKDRPIWLARQKIWNPSWIGHTALGKTFYATDYWIGKLAGHSGEFPAAASSGGQKAMAEAFLNNLAVCGGRDDGLSNRVMLRPTKVNWTWAAQSDGGLSCELHRIDMRVDGANVTIDPTGKENRDVNLNDPRFAAGRIAKLMTEQYGTIAALWPMFERLRQLNGLIAVTSALRDKGFRPNADMQAHIDATLQNFTTRPALTMGERLVL